MAKQSGGKPQIDEDFMKEIISQGLPVKKQETPSAAMETKIETPDKTDDKTDKQETAREEKTVKEPARRKKNASCDYRETYFMRVDLTDRQTLYVSRTTHEKLMKIVTVIGGRKATVSSYVENILLRHFDQFQDEINELYESKFEKPF
ncbi:DUF3408 domain-containing protein [Bacteroides cellulosilyticus]|uniref:DUF3408 domain-containing protein n=1 Tax=Bacteroides cellulosilyticus TaxID=246787 RepID=UPI00234E22E8|nr:DUF3408 domain-containing protein [Bacteroides cellulosilyticus]MDC7178464.1 DUF3408 domain-containing protein [Bacteroides cellulosilyticus]MDC7181661.1 DUF3408 domain-containing protein [Bacteroides cellulosilyticus]